MKKVLIITYYWPPSGGAGVQRWLKFVKYLREFNWEPVVYTPLNPETPATDNSLSNEIPAGLTVLQTKVWEPFTLYKAFTGRKKSEKIQTAFLSEDKKPGLTEKISIWIRGNFFIPDARKFWIKPSVSYLSAWVKDHPVDLIISTGPPHSMHMIALGLKHKTGLPWLADFRDPWTEIDFYHELQLTALADKKHHALEKMVLSTADRVSVISQGMAKQFNLIHPASYAVITNGFDESDYHAATPVRQSSFALAHIGSLVKTRNPQVLWKALSLLCDEVDGFSADLEIRLIGKTDQFVVEAIETAGLLSNMNKIDYLTHDLVGQEQQQANVLLLLINNTPNAKLILTGKLFEYMQSGRPILCIGPVDGDAASVLEETGTGKCIDFEDVLSAKAYILSAYKQFKAGIIDGNKADISKYTRRSLTGQLASLLNELLTEQ
ncbi:MAG: glycosyltransferase family 4 protein [Bacteroidales bacterium]|nr:glycosyltransferase family 4 protein [Bacteroidales bacterium]